jgi:hypothetical protein
MSVVTDALSLIGQTESTENLGAEISLCDCKASQLSGRMAAVFDKAADIAAELVDDNEHFLFRNLAKETDAMIRPYIIARSSRHTGVDILGNLKPGSYIVFAQWFNDKTYVSWLVPLKIASGKDVRLLLNNSNIYRSVKITEPSIKARDIYDYQIQENNMRRRGLEKLKSWIRELESSADASKNDLLKQQGFSTSPN